MFPRNLIPSSRFYIGIKDPPRNGRGHDIKLGLPQDLGLAEVENNEVAETWEISSGSSEENEDLIEVLEERKSGRA